MKKIIKLTESKLIELIENIVAEQQSGKMIPKPTTNKFLPPPMSNEPEVTKPEPGPETYEEAKELNAFNEKILALKNKGSMSPEQFMLQYNKANPSRPIKTPNDKIIPYVTTDKFMPPAMSKEPEVTKPEPAELDSLQESINKIVKRFKKTISEQTQNFPDDDGPVMKQILNSQLVNGKFAFKAEKSHSQSGGEMCKTTYTYETSKGTVFLRLRCCGPKDSPSSTVGKCGYVVVGIQAGMAPTAVKSFDINGFAMDSRQGPNVMFDLDKGKLQKAIDYANQLVMNLYNKYGSVITVG